MISRQDTGSMGNTIPNNNRKLILRNSGYSLDLSRDRPRHPLSRRGGVQLDDLAVRKYMAVYLRYCHWLHHWYCRPYCTYACMTTQPHPQGHWHPRRAARDRQRIAAARLVACMSVRRWRHLKLPFGLARVESTDDPAVCASSVSSGRPLDEA